MGKAEIGAGEFKAHCLRLIDEVASNRAELLVTKRGRPVAKLVPVEDKEAPALFGCLKGSILQVGDVMSPVEDDWDALR